jgi:hypothetical protein
LTLFRSGDFQAKPVVNPIRKTFYGKRRLAKRQEFFVQ